MPTVALSPEWGIEASEGLKATLATHLETADEVVLAAGEAGRVHSASIQVLAAFVRTRRHAGRTTRIAPGRRSFATTCRCCTRPRRPAATTRR